MEFESIESKNILRQWIPVLLAIFVTFFTVLFSGSEFTQIFSSNMIYLFFIALLALLVIATSIVLYFGKIENIEAEDVYAEIEKEELEDKNKKLSKENNSLRKKIEFLENHNIKAYSEIFLLENNLRRFVEKNMIKRWGKDQWISKIPEYVRRKCKEYREDAKKNSKLIFFDSGLTILSYSTLHELALIIKDVNNWHNVFEKISPGKDELIIVGDIEKLAQFRNHIAHNRPISEKEFSKIKSACEEINELISD